MGPKVCISVLNWNNYGQTIDCLKSLEKLDYDHYQVIVVDNASTDQSIVHILKAFPAVEIIRSDTNLGYAGGNELALRRALEDSDMQLFWILNNDSRVAPDTLSQFVSAYQQFGGAMYGGIPLSSDSLNGQWTLNFVLWKAPPWPPRAMTTDYHGLPYEDHFADPQPRVVPVLHGSSLLIPLAVVRQHGFMETGFFLYSEELDYCLRLGKKGIKSVLVPRSVIYHIGGGARKDKPRLDAIIEYYRTRNKLILFQRHSSRFSYMALCFVCTAVAIREFVYARIKRRDNRPRYLFRAIYDGMRGQLGKTLAPEDYLTDEQS